MIAGGGVAGLYAALTAAEEADVLLLAKGPVAASNSWQAQGGVAAALAEEDEPVLHAEDTFRAGRGLCRESAVRTLTEEAPARIEDLSRLGVEFDDDLGREGGHSLRRIAHVGRAETGKAIAAHIHSGVRGKPGPVIVPLCAPCRSGARGQTKVDVSVVSALESGRTYVNVHTKKNQAGEIRGQLGAAALSIG